MKHITAISNASICANGSWYCDDDELLVLESLWARASLVSAHAVTIAALYGHAYVMYATVEIAHPVFAVMFMEMVYLCLFETGFYIALLCVGVDYLKLNHPFFLIGVVMFHQVSWLFVTGLRYYLLVMISPTAQLDMRRLRRCALMGVWLAYAGAQLFCYAAMRVALGRFGYPDVLYTQMSRSQRFVLGVVNQVTVNLPDVASVAIYFALWCHYRRSASIVVPFNNVQQYQEQQQQQRQESVDSETPPPPPPNPSQPSEKDRIRSVLRALGVHALTAFADLLMIAISTIPHFGWRRIVSYHFLIFMSYWVPILVMRSNFEQMRRVTDFILRYFR